MSQTNTAREYRVNRYASIVGYGNAWQVINEVTGLVGDITYPSYEAARDAAGEVGNHYYTIERRAGWR